MYTAGKNFTLPPAVTGGTNLTSVYPFYQQCAFRWKNIFMTSLPILWLLILLPSLGANVLRVTLLQVFTDSIKAWDLSHMALHLSEKSFFWRQFVDVDGTLFSMVQSWQFRLQQAKPNVYQLLWWPKMWTGEFTIEVALEHSRVLAIKCSTVFTSDHPCIESIQCTHCTWVV